MKLGIAVKLGLLLAAVSVLAAGLTGLYAYEASRNLLLQSAKTELLTATGVMARRVSLSREDVSRNLMVLAGLPTVARALQGNDVAVQEQIATLFEQLMLANPGYLQIRLIAATDDGMERVRVDRAGQEILRIQGADLQRKGNADYVANALRLAVGTTYLSRITINHDSDVHAGRERPTVILSTPIYNGAGQPVGVIAINTDLYASFEALMADLPARYQLYLANGAGDFLIHPDSRKAFGFDRGQRVLMQNEFPDAAELVLGQKTSVITEVSTGPFAGEPVVASFMARGIKVASGEERIILGLAVPRARVLAQSDQLGSVVLKIVAALCAASVVLAAVVAHWVARPINAISRAVQRFGTDQQTEVPELRRRDELGVLARSFAKMQYQINVQLRALAQSHQELELLARHDSLTGLPNRRYFQERLDDALARAQRNKTRFAILFIDVDKFKAINDQYGHEAGDEVLKTLAIRLQANTRKVDTVARMGGDEFVVLLDSTDGQQAIELTAQKLLENVLKPIPWADQELDVGLSVGISQFPDNGHTAHGLLSSADHAMYRVKSGGQSGFQFADSNLLTLG